MKLTKDVIVFIQSFRNDFFDVFFNFISFIGEEFIYMILLGTMYYVFDKKKAEILAFALFFAGVFNNVLKGLVSAKRPFEKYPNEITNLRESTSTGSSFPSGHTQLFTTFYASVYYLFKKKWLLVLSITFSILMALSRMYLGVHFLEDVVVSILLGFLSAYLITKLITPLQKARRTDMYSIVLMLFFPFLFVIGSEDLFKTYGMLTGFVCAMLYEEQYVKFTHHNNAWKNILRVVFGLLIMVSIQSGLGYLFDFLITGEISMYVYDTIRYILMSFIGLGVYPRLFKKFNF